MKIHLKKIIRNHFLPSKQMDDEKLFDTIMAIQGESYRKVEQRETLKFQIEGKDYFIKKHFGVIWKVIFEALVRLRLPIISAKNEYRAISHLTALDIGVPEIIGFGKRGWFPTKIQSFIITKSLEPKQKLHTLAERWQETPPDFALKNWLVLAMANLMKKMHESGLNHRDCYLVHFLIDPKIHTQLPQKKPKIYVLDLHRAQIRKKTPIRWKVKDVSGLYFSSKHAGLTTRDLWRFMSIYSGKTLRQTLIEDKDFWRRVQIRGERLFQKETWRKNRFSIPLQLTLDHRALEHQKTLRHLPKKRVTFLAQWKGQQVVAKVFLGWKAAWNFQRELKQYQQLSKYDVLIPKLLFAGYDASNRYPVLVFEFLRKNNAPDSLSKITTMLAHLHEQGIYQEDLHLDNFIITDKGTYLIDVSKISTVSPPTKSYSNRNSENLALFLAQIKSLNETGMENLYRIYLQIRKLSFYTEQWQKILKQRSRILTQGIKRHLKKIYRSCSQYLVKQSWHYRLVCNRENLSAFLRPDCVSFLETKIREGVMLKAGNTCTVSKITMNGQDFVIKRYNIKNFWHGLKRAFQQSRASKNWENAHRLLARGFRTPKPIAFVEERFGPFRKKSYFVMEYMSGERVFESPNHKEQVQEILNQLHDLKITHGDTKLTNFIVHQDQIYIIDLDAMKKHRCPLALKRAIKKDIKRLKKH